MRIVFVYNNGRQYTLRCKVGSVVVRKSSNIVRISYVDKAGKKNYYRIKAKDVGLEKIGIGLTGEAIDKVLHFSPKGLLFATSSMITDYTKVSTYE